MNFYDLLNKYSNEQIIESLKRYYNDVVDEAYLFALKELRLLKPTTKPQNMEICVQFEGNELDETDKNLYLECDGLGIDEETGVMTRWALEFQRWEEWLAQEINEDCLLKLDELTILAGIMWELTFNGYSQGKVDERREELERRCEDTKYPEKWISMDELFEELEKEDEGADDVY